MRILFFLFFLCIFFGYSNDAYEEYDNVFASEDVRQVYEEQKLVKQKSGKYLAISLGTSYQRVARFIANPNDGSYIPIVLGLKTGAQSFFTKNIGIRGFFAFDTYTKVGMGKKEGSPTAFFGFFSLGIDAIAEFAITKSQKNFLGGFFGIGFGGVLYTDSQNYRGFKNMFISGGFIVEAGLELTLMIKHRIAIGAKVTPIQKNISQSIVERTDILPFVSYQYQF
ncbi:MULTISPECIES: outer membrane beta-barrel protein [unclassified Helicobacter]|uniref:outer membrane beta-barrel protein n=1 Tax=unclassified Helicobacter TaxID=2593540 RepID=UPI0013150B67|nr:MULTISPECIES: outer membrane beta-barrel protein [unclassified Helicobacter]